MEQLVVALSDPLACDPDVTGAKAANLARCAVAGLPTLPGMALTTAATARGLDDPEVMEALHSAWTSLAGPGRALVVRSSSTIEDAGASSMAGRFTSVLDVTTWDGFVAAVARVIASADAVRDADGAARPIGVLVQPQLDTALGGVMFGVDPVTGDLDHLVVEVVATRPDALVSGAAIADHYVLTRRGRVVARTTVGEPVALPRRVRRHLARLAARADAVFGGPQDVEWAVGRSESGGAPGASTVWLLQSRPVTAVAAGGPATGRHQLTMGPGPVAETFPEPLAPLEVELWVEPLREGIVRALRATGAVGERHLTGSPVVAIVGGRVAVDLGLLGATTAEGGWRRRVSPGAIGRRLGAAWRVGRLRVALPRLATTVVEAIDADLVEVGDLRSHDDARLVDLLHRARAELATAHSYEMLCGMLLRPGDPGASGPSAALVALARLAELRAGPAARDREADLVARAPELLALVPPSLRTPRRLPSGSAPPGVSAESVDDLPLRDALRLRVRWLQELQRCIVDALADRLAPRLSAGTATGADVRPVDLVAQLELAELAALVAGRDAPGDLASRLAVVPAPPLPVTFRIDASAAGGLGRVAGFGGATVASTTSDGGLRGHRHGRAAPATAGQAPAVVGVPAGGGSACGVVVHRPPTSGCDDGGATPGGWVLVTEHLGADLAVALTDLVGLVAETGSALSHVAILAREVGVATVAGAAGARAALPPGCRVRVDGTSGEVVVLDPPPDGGAVACAAAPTDASESTDASERTVTT